MRRLSGWFKKIRVGLLFTTLAHKGHMELIALPSNLDLVKHVEDFPPDEYGFKSDLKFTMDKLYYFLNLLTSIPARNNDVISDDGYVNICMNNYDEQGNRRKQGLRDSIKDIKSSY